MSVTRLIARPMLAAYFVADGIDAVRKPQSHVQKFARVQPLLERAGVPPVLSADATMLTRVTGAISAIAGLCLATGRRPRTAALTLAVLNLSLIHISEPTRLGMISYAVFCLKKKKKQRIKQKNT